MGQGSDRSAIIRELFDGALELDPTDRWAYLTTRCGADSELLQEVWSLIEFADERTGRGEPRTGSFASQVFIHKPGEQIGPYTVVGLLGSGAMADVYLASQVSPSRQVALKVLRPGSEPQTVARFRLESSALARMNHENIARVYEAGETDPAQPYIAMEFVQGETLTTYADRQALSIDARLTLLMALCDALEHIHQNGLIHRDLKPANIVVFESPRGPVPKVVDFGIAKSVEQHIHAAAHTIDGAILGTLEYASPEQLSDSHSVDTRSDIYSAGVILYELLIGTRPFLLRKRGLEGLLRAVREEEVDPPSKVFATQTGRTEAIARQRGTTPAHLTAVLRSDLDWIALRALHKSPAERYPTAGEFRADIERYLHQQPVHARLPSSGYRLRKALKRHRSATIGIGLVTAAALIGVTLILWQAAVARARLRDLEQLTASLVSSLNDLVDVPGAMQAKQRLVLAATETLESIGAQRPDAVLQEELATAYERVGQLRADPYTASLGDTQNGLNDLRRAVELRTRLYRMRPDAETATKLMQSQYTLAIVLQSAGSNQPPADSLLAAGALLGEALVARDTTAFEAQRVLSMIYDLQAEYAYPLGHWEEAVALVTRAHDMRQQLVHVPGQRTEAERLLGGSYGRLAYASQNCATAKSYALMALDIHEAYYRRHPFSYRALLDLTFAYRNAGYALRQNGENPGALAYYRRSVELRRTMAESDSTDLRSLYLLSDAYDALVDGYLSVGKADSASIAATTGLGIRSRIAARNDPPPWIGHAIEFSTRSLARTAWCAGDYARADTLYRGFCESRAFGSPLEGMKLWRDQVERAHALLQAGRIEAAKTIFVQSGELLRQIETTLQANRADGTAFADLALCYVHLAQTHARTSDWNIGSLRRAFAYPVSKADPRPVRAVIANELACSLADAGRLSEAEEALRSALQQPAPASEAAALRWNLMSVWVQEGRSTEVAAASVAGFPIHASTFRLPEYSQDLDPYARLHMTVFRKWPVWGEMPLPCLRRRVPI